MGNNVVIPADTLLEDGAQIIDAIRTGCVDAFVVEDPQGHAVYTLQSADLPYSTLVQRMQQGAAMLDAHGEVITAIPASRRSSGLRSNR